MLNQFFTLSWAGLHGLLVLLGLAVYAFASHTLRQRRHPSAAIAWVISLVLIPYLALPLYLLIGSRKLVGQRQTFEAVARPLADLAELRDGPLAASLGLPEAVTFAQLSIHPDGAQALQSLRGVIEGAQRSLDICTFLLGRDALGDAVVELLVQRARAGVRIRLLIDGIGFYMGGHPSLKRLRDAGAQAALFVSPLRSALRGRTNLRNHRKMVLADGARLWCGGRNLAAEYFEGDANAVRRKEPWIDLSFDLVGALAQQAQQRFDHDWAFATQGTLRRSTQRPASGAAAVAGARLVASGPDQADDTYYTLLVSGCFTARTRILAVTPYFVPDATLLMALTLAARRGVAVDLLLPRSSNHVLADIARHAALRELAAAGASVWLAPVMVHAKAVLIDEDLALVGSANLDERSLFLNYELMVAFYDPAVVQGFAQWIEVQRSDAVRHRPRPPGLARELVEGLVRWVAFQL
ncbi:MAG: phospholipase D-like domain-containing protein [Betaproteobacteria bacterium]